jgi:hypothetical protein
MNILYGLSKLLESHGRLACHSRVIAHICRSMLAVPLSLTNANPDLDTNIRTNNGVWVDAADSASARMAS